MELVKDTLIKLSNLCAPSGKELQSAEGIINILKNYTKDIKTDPLGNIIACVNPQQKQGPKLMLEAHYDEVALTVESIDDEGFVKFFNAISLDVRTLLSSEVIIHGKKLVYGIVSTMPPHLLKKEDSEKPIECGNLCIDTGFSAEKAREYISAGDMITFRPQISALKGNNISGKAMDNRAGVTAVIACLETLKNEKLPAQLWVCFSVQEEAGTKGVKTAVYSVNPDIAVIIDTTFAKTHDIPPEKAGISGAGPMIGISPILDRSLFTSLCKIAKEQEIPHQIEVMSGNTGTNAWSTQTVRNGIKTALVSIPIKYMHTQVETLNLSDLEATAKLCASFIKSQREVPV